MLKPVTKLPKFFGISALFLTLLASTPLFAKVTETETVLGTEKFKRPYQGKIIQPETTANGELGSDCAKSIRYWYSDKKNQLSNVVVTDFRLLKLKNHSLKALSDKQLDNLACMNAFHVNMGAVKNISSPQLDEVNAFLSYTAQDIGAFPPTELVVVGRRGSKVYLLWEQLSPEEYKINSCLGSWKAKTPDEEEKAFKTLTGCYKHAVENDEAIQKRLKEIATSLLSVL